MYVFLYNTIKWPYQPKHSPSFCTRKSCVEQITQNRKCVVDHPIIWSVSTLRVMGAGLSEGHQGMVYYPALRHAQDVSEVSPLSYRTQQVVHWRCGCVPIVPASDDMQASAVEAVDTAHHCVWFIVSIHCIVAYACPSSVFSRCFSISCRIANIASVVPLPGMKPNCSSSIVVSSLSLLSMILSQIFIACDISFIPL